MATFLAMQQEVADRLNIDQTVTANATRLKRWLNLTQQDITSRYPFDWLFEQAAIQTVVDRTAGTVSVANGSTAVTGVGTAFAATDAFCFIQFEGDTNWYEVNVVGGTTSITLTLAYGGTTVTDGTYVLRTFYYSLAAGAFEVFDMRQTSTPAKLTCLGFWTLDSYQPNIQTVGPPVAYALFRQDPSIAVTAAKRNQVALFPIPDAVYNIDYRYRKVLSDITADTDIAMLPRPYHSVMIDGAEWMGSKYLNLANQDQLKTAYEYSIEKLIERENSHKDWLPVLGSNDTQLTSRFLPFPTTFEQPK